jgi:hypothetical protein
MLNSMHRLPSRAVAIVLATSAVLGIAGCGGNGSSADTTASDGAQPGVTNPAPVSPGETSKKGATSDAAGIRAAITGVLVSGDPARACERDVTATYVATTYGDQKACKQAQLPGSAAKSVKVSAISVDGDSASAVAVPSGGPSDGDRLKVSLVRGGGSWRVDALKSNAPVGP